MRLTPVTVIERTVSKYESIAPCPACGQDTTWDRKLTGLGNGAIYRDVPVGTCCEETT